MKYVVSLYVGIKAIWISFDPYFVISFSDLLFGGAMSSSDDDMLKHCRYIEPNISKIFMIIAKLENKEEFNAHCKKIV